MTNSVWMPVTDISTVLEELEIYTEPILYTVSGSKLIFRRVLKPYPMLMFIHGEKEYARSSLDSFWIVWRIFGRNMINNNQG